MAVNSKSVLRKIAKRILFPLFGERYYKYFQALGMARDIRTGKFHEPELKLVPLVAREGDTVLDLGANYGLYTVHLSRAVGRAGTVHAFEPIPFTFATLQVIVRLFGLRNVRLVPKGCSDSAGRVEFAVPLQASGALSAGQAYLGARNDDHAGKEGQVRWSKTTSIPAEVVPLDDYGPDLDNVTFIKADIEGAELLAFRGAERLIERNRPTVLCEINPWFLDGFGLRLEELLRFFADRGYSLYRYGEPEHRLLPISSAEEVTEANYLFVHPRWARRLAGVLSPADEAGTRPAPQRPAGAGGS